MDKGIKISEKILKESIPCSKILRDRTLRSEEIIGIFAKAISSGKFGTRLKRA